MSAPTEQIKMFIYFVSFSYFFLSLKSIFSSYSCICSSPLSYSFPSSFYSTYLHLGSTVLIEIWPIFLYFLPSSSIFSLSDLVDHSLHLPCISIWTSLFSPTIRLTSKNIFRHHCLVASSWLEEAQV